MNYWIFTRTSSLDVDVDHLCCLFHTVYGRSFLFDFFIRLWKKFPLHLLLLERSVHENSCSRRFIQILLTVIFHLIISLYYFIVCYGELVNEADTEYTVGSTNTAFSMSTLSFSKFSIPRITILRVTPFFRFTALLCWITKRTKNFLLKNSLCLSLLF